MLKTHGQREEGRQMREAWRTEIRTETSCTRPDTSDRIGVCFNALQMSHRFRRAPGFDGWNVQRGSRQAAGHRPCSWVTFVESSVKRF